MNTLIPAAASAFGRLGGEARARALTAHQRSRIARKAALARARKLSAEQRSAIARLGAEARWAHRRSAEIIPA